MAEGKVIKLKRKNKKKLKIANKDGVYKLLRFIYFCIYLVLFFIFMLTVNHYAKTSTYEDDEVIVKEMPLGYNVYKKDGQLKEVNFFNGRISDKELKIFVKNQLLFENKGPESVILKDPTNLNKKTQKDVIKDIIIKKIVKVNKVNYVTLYVKKDNKGLNNYCFKMNNLDFSKKDEYCFLKSKKELEFSFTQFKKYYVFGLKDKVYIYNPATNKIDMIINTNSEIVSLDRNTKNDIKVVFKKGEKILSHVYIQYFLNKRIELKKDIMILSIKRFL